jgi:arabinogalactan oligomer/maltooligosaccharide transport system substrate-binding protein
MTRGRARAGQSSLMLLLFGVLAVAAVLLVWVSFRPVDRREIVIWTGFKDTEIAVLRKAADAFEQSEHVPVRIVRVPFTELQPKIQVSVPVGQGPDLVTGPHDWIGTFVQAGMLGAASVDEAARAPYLKVALEAMSYQGRLYGLPLSVSTLGLVVNRKLVPDLPTSMPDLIEKAKRLTRGGQYGFLFDDTDFYFAYPFFGGYGAYIFPQGAQGLDDTRVGLDSPGAIRAAQFLADLHQKWQLMPPGTNKNNANSAFLGGECAMTITGPWALQDYRDKHIDYVFMPIPILDNGRWPQPLVGVDGVMLTACSRNPEGATRLMLALASQESEVELNLSAGRIPARRDAQADPRVAQNPDVPAIGACVEKGIPMPSIPAVQLIWQPMEDALKLITTGEAQPAEMLHQTAARILDNIRKSKE